MKNKITNLKISNFKSIREAELECGRINLFVGKPNVGKSNLLEAISTLGATFHKGTEKFLPEFIRYDSFKNLFHFYNTDDPIIIRSNIGGSFIDYKYKHGQSDFYIGPNDGIDYLLKHRNKLNDAHRREFEKSFKKENNDINPGYIQLQSNGDFLSGGFPFYSPVKKYLFKTVQNTNIRDKSFLLPPFGENLFSIIESNNKLKKEIPPIFDEYGFGFLLDLEENKMAIQRVENGISYKIPYNLIADTIQRIIFHYAAIFSNKDSVILFEEPESHSFPPYIRELALKIIESKDNQFFITTHSPHLFNTIVEEVEPDDLAIFITYFENYETRFKKLNTNEINDLLNDGIDIFFNQKWFLNE